MKFFSKCIVLLLVILFIATPHTFLFAATQYDTYIWQKNIMRTPGTQAQPLIDQLNNEIQAIVAVQPLAPLVMHYSDQPDEGYAIYHDRGRIITTLAMSYPYVTTALQSQIKTYVSSALSSKSEAFFNSQFKSVNEGVERRLHGYPTTISSDKLFKNISTLYVIYGIWLYGENTQDWQTVQNYWTQIKTFYSNNKNTNILYGSLSGYIGMARLARQFNDTTTLTSVESDINTQFSAAGNPSTIDSRQKSTSYSYFFDSRKVEYFPGQPWMYLNISPEIARFITDNATIKNDYLNRLNQFSTMYSPWWLYQLPIFTRWTGDEGAGTTPELFGMFFPAERWVKNTKPQDLEKFMRSIPTGIGDSFWIESLVSTIESYGQNCWKNIQTGTETCGSTPILTPGASVTAVPTSSSIPGDTNKDGKVNGADFVTWLNHYNQTTSGGASIGDFNNDSIVNGADFVVWLTHYSP